MKKSIIFLVSVFLIFNSLYSQILDADIEVFKNMINNKMFDDVIFIIKDSISSNPDYEKMDELLYLLAEAYYGLGKYEKAYDKYLDIYEKHRNSAQFDNTMYKIGEVAYRLNDNRTAIEFLTHFILNFPDNSYVSRAKYFAGESFIRTNQFEKGIEFLKPIASDFDNQLFFHANYSLGWIYYNLNEYRKSIDYFKNVENRAEFAISNLHIGESYLRLEDFSNARSYFNKIPSNADYYVDALYFLSVVANRTDNEREFIQTVDTLNRLFPADNLTLEANYNIATYLYNNNKLNSALKYYNNIIKYENIVLHHENLKELLHLTYYFSAWTNQQLFNETKNNSFFNEAVKLYKTYISRFENETYYQRSLFRLGEIYADNNDIENSIKYYELVRDPDLYDRALFDIARLLIKNNNQKRAVEYLIEIQKNAPDSELLNESNFLIAKYYFDEKEYSKAILYYEKFIDLEKNNIQHLEDAYFNIAWSYSNLNNRKQAINYFNELLGRYPNTNYKVNANFQLSRLHFEENDYNKAENILLNLKTSDLTDENRRLYNLAVINTNRADDLVNENRFNDAINYYNEALKYYKSSKNIDEYITTNLTLSDLYFQQNNFNESNKVYEYLLNTYPNDKNRLYFIHGLGWNNYKLNNYSQAIEYFKQFNRDYLSKRDELDLSDKLFQESLLLLGESFNNLDNYDKTYEYYNEYIKHFPNGLYANDIKINLSKIIAVNKSPEQALELLLNEYYNVPNMHQRKDITYNISIIFFDIENYNEFLHWSNIFFSNWEDADYERVLRFNEIISHYRLNNYSQSIQLASNFIERYPDFEKNDQLYFLKGAMNFNDKNYNKALSHLNTVINRFRNSDKRSEAFYLSGLSYYYLNNYNNAIKFFNDLIELYPNSTFINNTLNFKVISLSRLNQHNELLSIVDSIIDNEEDILRKIRLNFYKGRALYNLKEYNEAVQILNQTISLYTSNEKDERVENDDIISKTLFELGNVYLDLENIRFALLQFGRIVNAYPFENYVDKAQVELAKIYISLDRLEAAKNILENFKTNFPESNLQTVVNDLMLKIN